MKDKRYTQGLRQFHLTHPRIPSGISFSLLLIVVLRFRDSLLLYFGLDGSSSDSQDPLLAQSDNGRVYRWRTNPTGVGLDDLQIVLL